MVDWDRIVSNYGQMVFSVAWHVLGNTADAEDVTQEVFLEVLRVQRTQMPQIQHLPSFLRRVATLRALDALRKRKPHDSVHGLQVAAQERLPEKEAAFEELKQRLRAEVAKLPKQQAAVYCLHAFEQMSHDQIAACLKISKSAVAVGLHKARRSLQRVFTDLAIRDS